MNKLIGWNSPKILLKNYLIQINKLNPRKFLNYSNNRFYSNELYNDYRDYVFVDNIIFHGYHGNIPEEKILGQKFECSIKLYPKKEKLLKFEENEELNDTLDYTIIINEIEKLMKSKSYNLIEKLGNEIARNAFKAYGNNKLEAIQIKIRKPQVPITQIAKCVGVNIFRTYRDFS